MSILDLIHKDNYYLATCIKLAKNYDDGYDLMMNTALKIHEKEYTLDYPHSLFYTIALRDFIKNKKTVELNEKLHKLEDEEYKLDIIDFAHIELAKPAKNKREFVTKNIFSLFLKNKTKSETSRKTNINRKVIEYHVNKFEKYVRENYSNIID